MSASSDSPPSTSLRPIYQRILAYPPLDWILLFIELGRYLYRFITRDRHTGMYEILAYDTTLELCDSGGEVAVFKKRQRVKFLQDNVLAFQDFAWGDGDIFADYQCSPGKVVDCYQEGDRWNILISLHESKNAGDVVDFNIERTVHSGFTKADESRQIEIRHHTKWMRMAVIFPAERHCQRAVLVQRSRNKSIVLGPEHYADLPDGRQVVSWESNKIRRLEIYTLKWTW